MSCFDLDREGAVFLPGNVPSLKNSKVMTSKGIFSSKTVVKYLRFLGIQTYSASKKEVKEYKDPSRLNIFRVICNTLIKEPIYPVLIYTHFVRDSKRKCDFNNMTQILADLLTAHDFIPDDNMDYIYFVPWLIDGEFYSVDKLQPGVWMRKVNACDL